MLARVFLLLAPVLHVHVFDVTLFAYCSSDSVVFVPIYSSRIQITCHYISAGKRLIIFGPKNIVYAHIFFIKIFSAEFSFEIAGRTQSPAVA
jgi:hypothetical protein